MDNNTYITEIENEYKKIDTSWLRLHFRTAVGLVLFACLVECILGAVLFYSGAVDIHIRQYVTKYIITPFLLNLFIIGVGFLVMFIKAASQRLKVYLISLFFVAICFILYSVHRIYPSLYLIFVVPVLLTVVYNKYVLTIVTSVFSIALKILSDLVVYWDPDAPNPNTDQYTVMDFIISICILCAFSVVCLVVIHFERAKNNAAIIKEIDRHQLQRRLRIDDLTGISNKVALREAFQAMEDDASDNAYILAMIDIDNFKLFNDTLGHDTGDEVLKAFGSVLAESCGDALAFRFGGDEFCVLFKNEAMDNILEKCCLIQERCFAYAEKVSKDLPITVSIGVARYTSPMTASQLIKNTDDALYRSKLTKNSINVYAC
jgi:diguanylate cyclase